MNWAHIHLLLNHLPVIGCLFGCVMLAVSVAMRNHALTRTGLWVLVFVALVSIPVYVTGTPAEDLVRHLPGTSDAVLERHERAASIALAGAEVLGLLSLAWLILPWRGIRRAWVTASITVLSVAMAGIMAWTAYLGAQVRHPEVRPGFRSADRL